MQARDLFEVLAREHARMLHVYVRCISHETEADDLVQETLVTAWRSLDHFDRTKAFGPWLRGIARNVVLAHHRRTARHGINYDPAWMTSLEDHCAALQRHRGDNLDEKLHSLRDCIDQLPEPYRETIRLRYQEDQPPEVLTVQLKISLENLKKRIQRGKQWLFDCLMGKLQSEEAYS